MKYNNWNICVDTYTTPKVTVDGEVVDVNLESKHSIVNSQIQITGEDVMTISTPTPSSNKQAALSIMTNRLMGDSKHIVFSLDDTMSFGDNYSHNGYVSFVFFHAINGYDFDSDFPLPNNANHITYDTKYLEYSGNEESIGKAEKTGGIAPWFWNNPNLMGATLTLFPAKDGSDNGTRNVSYYKLSIKNFGSGHEGLLDGDPEQEDSTGAYIYSTANDVIIYEDELPESIDLGKVSSLSINTWKDDYIRLILNGMELISFAPFKHVDPTVVANLDILKSDVDFVMSCMGAKASPVGFKYYSLNGISAYDASTAN